MIARRWQADEIERIRTDAEALLIKLVDNNRIRRLLKTVASKDIHQTIHHALHTVGTIDMNIGCAWITLRPGTGLQKRHQVRDVIGMEV